MTVTGVNDALDDGDQSYTIVTAAATSSDPAYSGVNAADVIVSNTDNDDAGSAGITVTAAAGLTTTEAGGTAAFTVVLASEPTANVTVGLSSSDTTEGTVSPASLTFTTGNWSTPQNVTVTGVDDAVGDGDQSYTIVTAAATSSDPTYSGVNAADVIVSNTDNDTGAPPQARQATQSGSATIADTNTSTTVTITSVEMTRAFLVFSTTLSDSTPANTQVRGELTNSTTLKFTRSGNSGSVTIKWSVVEYATGVTVQRGTTAALTGTDEQHHDCERQHQQELPDHQLQPERHDVRGFTLPEGQAHVVDEPGGGRRDSGQPGRELAGRRVHQCVGAVGRRVLQLNR